MQKFSQFYVAYRNIVQFNHSLWKLDYFEKSVLELMADPVHLGTGTDFVHAVPISGDKMNGYVHGF